MKKSLFALAAVTAFAGAAQAQSSVTVYGILDVGFDGSTQRGIATDAATPTGRQSASFNQGMEQSNRLGFKGVEDLGGGMSAFFTVETGLNPTGATFSNMNNRQSFVGLKKNGIGQFSIGTQYTTIFNAAAATDPGQLNNMSGNVIYATATGASAVSSATGSSIASSVTGQNDAFATRAANMLSVSSDTFAGIQLNGMYTLNNVNSSMTSGTNGGNTNYNGWGLGANYTFQKLFLTANYQALKSVNPGILASPSPSIWGGTTYTGVNTQDNGAYVAGTYDFGILKAYAQWVTRKATDTINTGYYAKRNAQQLGVRSYITPVIEAWASVGNGRLTSFGAGNPTVNFTAYQLGSNYYLSKRTNLYAIYGTSQTSGVYTGVTSAPASVGGYALGLRHTF